MTEVSLAIKADGGGRPGRGPRARQGGQGSQPSDIGSEEFASDIAFRLVFSLFPVCSPFSGFSTRSTQADSSTTSWT